MLTQDQIIEIADKKAKVKGLNLDEMYRQCDENNEMWKEYFNYIREDEPDYASHIDSVLEGRDYQAVYYHHKNPGIIDGDLFLLIDRKTGKVLFSLP